MIPKEIAEQHSIIVFKKIENVINVATTNPDNLQTIEFVKRKTGFEPKVYITTPQDIEHALKRYKSEITEEFDRIIKESISNTLAKKESAEKLAQDVPIIKMVNNIIEQALNRSSSDIHFEPSSPKIIIRFRIDGMLKKVVELPKEVLPPLETRIKIMSNLKIDEHNVPQDGRFKYAYKDREVAVRVSVIPTLNGAKIVMRLLDVKERQFNLSKLGLNQRDLQIVKREIQKPYGMILVTGPTGSGKTTTLYSMIRILNKEAVNICTIEDPIEYGIEGINQTQINPTAGLTFANGLRSLLRQDPNILMVGEIRDVETADIAVNTAMTGHLVLSTLHTNNSFLAIQRMIEMGVEPFLTASVVNLIISQRLVRKICTNCKRTASSKQRLLERYRTHFDIEGTFKKLKKMKLLSPGQNKSAEDIRYYQGKGCAKCSYTGYQGRIGIYEVLRVDQIIYDAILKDHSADAIEKIAKKQNFLSMTEDGLLKVFTGVTTFEELLRVAKNNDIV